MQVDENGNLVVARVMAGGVIEKQGLLRPGDVILEVNNVDVTTPDGLQFEVNKARENVSLRIAPNPDNVPSLKTHQVFWLQGVILFCSGLYLLRTMEKISSLKLILIIKLHLFSYWKCPYFNFTAVVWEHFNTYFRS